MSKIQRRVYEIVADPPEGDTLGQTVNFAILILITANVLVSILETEALFRNWVESWSGDVDVFFWFEAFSVALFSIEYLLRLWSCTSQEEYRESFRGRLRLSLTPMALVDLFAILPFYLQAVIAVDMRFIRVLRLLRLFRLFRVGRFAESFQMLGQVVRGRKEELIISVMVLLIMLTLSSSLMYLVESGHEGTQFTSVPASMWWGIITITTIGYGDMYPVTALGRVLGAVVGFLGVCVFALPVGILGSGFVEEMERRHREQEEEAAAAVAAENEPARVEEKLKALARWREEGLIEPEQFETKRQALLDAL